MAFIPQDTNFSDEPKKRSDFGKRIGRNQLKPFLICHEPHNTVPRCGWRRGDDWKR